MVTQIDIKEIHEVAFDEEISWWVISTVNQLLEKARINAKFETQQQNIYFAGKEGDILRLVIDNSPQLFARGV